MADSEIKIMINAILQDKDFKSAIKKMSSDMDTSSKSIKKSWESVVIGFNQGLELLKKGFNLVKNVIKEALDLSQTYSKYKTGMDILEKTTGESANKIIEKLKEISKGAVSNNDLLLASNKAVALGVADSSETLAQLMEVARLKAQRMGIDTTQAFDNIVTGIGRASPLILDNLGIMTKGWDEEAKAKGVSFDKQFILNKVLEQGRQEIKLFGNANITTAENVQSLSASFENIKLVIGKFAEKYLAPIIAEVARLAVAFSDFIERVSKFGSDLTKNDEAMLRSGKNWQFRTEAVLKQNDAIYKATKQIEEHKKRMQELNNEMNYTNVSGERAIEIQEKINHHRKEAAAVNKKVVEALKELGYEAITNAEQFKKAYEATREITLEQGKGGVDIVNTEGEKIAELKKINDDYYTYIGDLGAVKREQEYTDYENALVAAGDNALALEEIEAMHLENLKMLDEETTNYRLELQRNAMAVYGQNYVNLTLKQKGEILKMTQDQMKFYEDMKTGMKSAAESVVTDYSRGIARMIVQGEIWHKSFKDFIKDLISAVLELIVQLTIAAGIKAALSGIGLGFLFAKGGRVPDLRSGKVVYAQTGFAAHGTDTVPAMLTPGERVLTVDQNRAFESLVRSFAIPNQTNTTNNQNIAFNGDFNLETMSAQDLVSQLMALAENTNTRLFRR